MDVNKRNDLIAESSPEMLSQRPKRNKGISKKTVTFKESVTTLQNKKRKLYNINEENYETIDDEDVLVKLLETSKSVSNIPNKGTPISELFPSSLSTIMEIAELVNKLSSETKQNLKKITYGNCSEDEDLKEETVSTTLKMKRGREKNSSKRDIADQKMRDARLEDLNSSFIAEIYENVTTLKDVQIPELNINSQLVTIPEIHENGKEEEAISIESKNTANNKLYEESVTRIEEWLLEDQPKTLSASDDITRNILEKLNAAVPKIDKITTWKFIHMFADLQKCQDKAKEKRRVLFTKTIEKINQISEELNERYSELHSEFSQELERRAAEFL